MSAGFPAALAGAAWLALAAPLSVAQTETPAPRWYKGNLHAHTTESDGDSTPEQVALWYKGSGYQFLAITDHDRVTEVAGLNARLGEFEKFLVIRGEEVSDAVTGLPVHLSAYNPAALVRPARGDTVAQAVQNNLHAILAAGGLGAVNHPNFAWAIRSTDLLGVEGLLLLEIHNGHPHVNNRGGGPYESTEEIWDALLSAGKRVYGIAVDDAHQFRTFAKNLANPGRGWVTVRAPSLTVAHILSALQCGDFYASTGVELTDVNASEWEYSIRIKAVAPFRYRTLFIGAYGQVLAVSRDDHAVYHFQGGEQYVRARIEASNGDNAWTQPFFPGEPIP